jgi:hypothetical protein
MMREMKDRDHLRGKAKRTAQVVAWGVDLASADDAWVWFIAHTSPFNPAPVFVRNIARREQRRRRCL